MRLRLNTRIVFNRNDDLRFITDFEFEILNACAQVFPDSNKSFCLFQLMQIEATGLYNKLITSLTIES